MNSHSNAALALKTLVVFVLLNAALVHAQQYRWIDGKGRVQYTDTPPPAGSKGVQKKNLDAGPPGLATQPYALQIALKGAPVKLYSSPDCGSGCDQARKLLNQRGIPFSEISAADPVRLEELKTLAGEAMVPVMVVGKAVQKGFLEGSYHSALDAAGYPPAGVLRPRDQAAPAALQPAKPPASEPGK